MDQKKNLHQAKKVRELGNHNCRYECTNNISKEQRLSIFKEYWALSDWNLQTAFLNGTIEVEPVKRRNMNAVNSKQVSCIYNLGGFRVCKEFLMKTLDVSNKRLQNLVAKKKEVSTGVASKDKRGKATPPNKIPDIKIEIIKEHINKFPKYSSHYTRNKTPNRKYLPQDCSLKEMYKLYCEFCREEKQDEPVKESFYRNIFNTQFNLSFKRPNTDTCDKCDQFKIKIDHGEGEEKALAQREKELHLRKAEAVKTAKDECHDLNDESQAAIVFDLQKTMPTPNVSTSKAYYLRQLWTYNFGVHNLQTGTAHCFMWHEGQASRGCQEISSCLLKYIRSLPPSVKHLTAFSDNCGGQNKSHYTVKFWLYIVRNTNIETVDHRFFVCGHSYNECDQDFGLIELKKKRCQKNLYVPQDWMELVSSSSRKFITVKMEDVDFVDLDALSPYFRKTVTGIQSMQWLHFQKDKPFTLFYKKTAGNEIEEFSELSMKSNRAGRIPAILPDLMPVQNEKKPRIKQAKYSNLQQLLHYVPPIHHGFYMNLRHDGVQDVERMEEESCQMEQEEGEIEDLDQNYDTDDE